MTLRSSLPSGPSVGHDRAVPTRVLTWNLQGREHPDLDEVAGVIEGFGPDVVALQEVHRRQVRALAERLGWASAWRFKHWSVVVRPEGLAVLAPAPAIDLATVHLAHRLRFWSWRRRIAVRATISGPDGPLALVATHLGAGVGDEERTRQARRTVDAVAAGPAEVVGACIVGDLNTHPGSPVLAAYGVAGFRDAWADARPDEPGATNWRPGPRDAAPTQRLDYVLVSDSLTVLEADVPAAGEPGARAWGELSDHLPVVVTLAARDVLRTG